MTEPGAGPYCSFPEKDVELVTWKGDPVRLLKDYWLLWAGLCAIILGFLTLEAGRLTLGPLFLVGGYCVLLPFFLWRSFRNSVGE